MRSWASRCRQEQRACANSDAPGPAARPPRRPNRRRRQGSHPPGLRSARPLDGRPRVGQRWLRCNQAASARQLGIRRRGRPHQSRCSARPGWHCNRWPGLGAWLVLSSASAPPMMASTLLLGRAMAPESLIQQGRQLSGSCARAGSRLREAAGPPLPRRTLPLPAARGALSAEGLAPPRWPGAV